MTAQNVTPQCVEQKTSRLILARCGQPEEVTTAVAWLVSDEATDITGQTINVSGEEQCHETQQKDHPGVPVRSRRH